LINAAPSILDTNDLTQGNYSKWAGHEIPNVLVIAAGAGVTGLAGRALLAPAAAEEFPGAAAAAKIPDAWGAGSAARSGGGWRWADPQNPAANGARIDPGNPGSPDDFAQIDHVHVRSGGQVIGSDGNPVPSGLAGDPAAHIPLSDWLDWLTWNTR
jgi:hypothetical protein